MTPKQILLDTILNKINTWQTQIERRRELDYDIQYKALENSVCGLLNLVYDYRLVNMNRMKRYYPAIDLKDSANRIAVQVTTTKKRKKVLDTIRRFMTCEPDAGKYRLILFVAGSRGKYLKEFPTEQLAFSKEDDIWDFSTVMRDMENLPTDKLRAICDYLESRITFDAGKYEEYLHRCREECVLLPSRHIEFVRDENLFREFRSFVQYSWLGHLLDEIEALSGQDSSIPFDRAVIDPGMPTRANLAVIRDWLLKAPQNKQYNRIRCWLEKPSYKNCLFLSGYYGSGRTRLLTETALELWNKAADAGRPVFVFVEPKHRDDPEASICAAFEQLLGKVLALEDCLNAFGDQTLVIVLDDIHVYIQNDVTIRKLFQLIRRLSRPNMKWVILNQTGYEKDPDDQDGDDFETFAYKWSDTFRDATVKAWLLLDDWYKMKDMPQRILEQEADCPHTPWAGKKWLYSTNYYNPLLASVLILYERKTMSWSFLEYESLLFPDFCRKYYRLLAQDEQKVKYIAVRMSGHFWDKRSLLLELCSSGFADEESDRLVNRGLLSVEDADNFRYRGTPDLVWYYLLANVFRDKLENRNNKGLDPGLLAHWDENRSMLRQILSIWLLDECYSEKERLAFCRFLMGQNHGAAVLDSAFKCGEDLRRQVIELSLQNVPLLRENFVTFLLLCSLGRLETGVFHRVIDRCIDKCSGQIIKYGDLFAYMLLRNYETMDWADILRTWSHLVPLSAKRVDMGVLRKIGLDAGRKAAGKLRGEKELNCAICQIIELCSGKKSNERETDESNRSQKKAEFPVGMHDGLCSGLCTAVIEHYHKAGYEALQRYHWYTFAPATDENQLRRNKALTFALAYVYRGDRQGSEYSIWYEALVDKLAHGTKEQKEFALFLILHSGRKEDRYMIPGSSPLWDTGYALMNDRAVKRIWSRNEFLEFKAVNFFVKA